MFSFPHRIECFWRWRAAALALPIFPPHHSLPSRRETSDHHAAVSGPSGDSQANSSPKGRRRRGDCCKGSQRHLAGGCHPQPVSMESWLETCTDEDFITRHLNAQHPASLSGTAGQRRGISADIIYSRVDDDVLTRVRAVISTIFISVLHENQPLVALQFWKPTSTRPGSTIPEWYIRVHLPIRISPRGSPLLVLSALNTSKIDRREAQQFQRVLCDGDLSKQFQIFIMKTEEEVRLFRYILRLNSTKIQPNPWQIKNLPQGGGSPYLATFVAPFYLDGACIYEEEMSLKPAGSCVNCGEDAKMKHCSRCKITPYCSVKCQRDHWHLHKLTCSKT